ncbi:hypothetical protein H4R24_001478 [Coemansia sp. RSA 988]|nr:hypothetical protein H4R24_001478 [Coemansia sp. RSA 988]
MDETQYLLTVFEEWLPLYKVDIPDELQVAAVETVLEFYGTGLGMFEFIEEYLKIALDYKIAEDCGHMCMFMFADISEEYIESRADSGLCSLIDTYLWGSLSSSAKACGRVSINGGEYIEFDDNTTLGQLGLEPEGYEKLEFDCQFSDA